jgi:hypothetical protein
MPKKVTLAAFPPPSSGASFTPIELSTSTELPSVFLHVTGVT